MLNDDENKLRKNLTPGATAPEAAWLEEMRRRYPFFPAPEAAAIKGGKEASADELQRQALSAADPEATEELTGHADPRLKDFYPREEASHTPDTNTAIDDFLERYAHTTPEEEALLERMIFNPVPDYAQQLARQADNDMPELPQTEADTPDARINRFIIAEHSRQSGTPHPAAAQPHAAAAPAKTPAATPRTDNPAPAPITVRKPETPRRKGDAPLLSESLAKIYIKSHKYERAYEILHRLSLDFPEKSRYFADQLRFLRKLIINERARKATNNGSEASRP